MSSRATRSTSTSRRNDAGAAPAPLDVRDLGRAAYREAWALQRRLVEARLADEAPDTLLVCEHDPVVTVGRATPDAGAGAGPAVLDDRFDVVEVERGGEATYHGPGQVVIYPIVKLAPGARDLHRYLRALEQAVIDALADTGLPAARRPGATGVWTADAARKLCSIGVAASRWVTWHGLALNHAPDLSHFAAIRPCGFSASVMTSVERELGAERCPARAELVARLVAGLRASLQGLRAAG